ncbi:MAG: hypothetical protein J6C38_06505 [Oscillospiraceae bacterium]|nr:hypothetical protein [Oscillospiraceae bacterium]
MKKKTRAIITAALIPAVFTACEKSVPESQPNSQVSSYSESSDLDSTADKNVMSSTDRSSNNVKNDVNDANSDYGLYPVTATCRGAECYYADVEGVYGETEIPDILCDKVDAQGSARPIQVTPIGLEKMIFEVHTFGDYTVKLVGQYVRTDKENFPGTIYARELYIEIENEKSPLSKNDGKIFYAPTILGQGIFKPEYRIFPERIGTYLDIYDMEYPIVAMRYYLDDTPEYVADDISEVVRFAMILPNRNSVISLSGNCKAGLGIVFDTEPSDNVEIVTNSETVSGWPYVLCGNNIKVSDKKTLIDETARIKYSFDFSDISSLDNFSNERLTVEKL